MVEGGAETGVNNNKKDKSCPRIDYEYFPT